MFRDIVLPRDNEEDFVSMASNLGYRELCFLYNLKEFKECSKKISAIHSEKKIKISFGILARNDNEVIASKRMSDFVVMKSREDVRNTIEKFCPGMIFGVELSERKDFMHHRNSGLNQVIAKIAYEKNVIMGIAFNLILKSSGFRRSVLLGRISQNIRLCRKYKTKIKFFSLATNPLEMRSPNELISLCVNLGMQMPEARVALSFD